MKYQRRVGRREWLRSAGKTAVAGWGLALSPSSIRRALAIEPSAVSGSIQDVQHVVVLMQENRSFDHYFGTMAGVRGFGDRSLVPHARGNSVFAQRDGGKCIYPFHLDTQSTRAMRVEGAPHSWPDAQLAWDHGRISEWPRFKQFQSMGYYEQDDIPFQRALADAFTICDAHHCSIQTGTFANRLVFMSGTNFTPGRAEASTSQSHAAIDNENNRGAVYGSYDWTTYPERLQAAGVSWRIYQEDDWQGLLAPWQAFKSYQQAKPGEALFDNALSSWTLDALAEHVANDALPQVSWILPPPVWSEHPAYSSPVQGASFIQRILNILTSNPGLWSRTVFLITFDENDGFFDHAPPPAPPSIDDQGNVCGGSTLDDAQMAGLYFRNDISGTTAARPFGLGPRVPLLVVSPWSRGGWVCSQVFDHTSTIRFLEARFGVEEPNISAWHRAVSGDLTQCFDFSRPSIVSLPALPDMSGVTDQALELDDLPPVTLPEHVHMPVQDPGVRLSRSLSYRLTVDAAVDTTARAVTLGLINSGACGAVFHVYDRLHLDRIPCRYTVESGKRLTAVWATSEDDGYYDLEIFGPNGLRWLLAGVILADAAATPCPEVLLREKPGDHRIELWAANRGDLPCTLVVSPNVYRGNRETSVHLPAQAEGVRVHWPVSASGFWYDLSVTSPEMDGWSRRFAGRVETGRHGISDPALGGSGKRC